MAKQSPKVTWDARINTGSLYLDGAVKQLFEVVGVSGCAFEITNYSDNNYDGILEYRLTGTARQIANAKATQERLTAEFMEREFGHLK